MEFKNESTNTFSDISSEEFRTYIFIGGEITIQNPTHLSVSKNGHRLFDAQGICHYVPTGWIHLKWKVKEGQPHFVK